MTVCLALPCEEEKQYVYTAQMSSDVELPFVNAAKMLSFEVDFFFRIWPCRSQKNHAAGCRYLYTIVSGPQSATARQEMLSAAGCM